MSRYLAGMALGLCLVLLLGAGGDDDASADANKIKWLDRQVTLLKSQVGRSNSRLQVLEHRVSQLEKKAGVDPNLAGGDKPEPDKAATDPAPAAEPAEGDADADGDMSLREIYLAQKRDQQIVKNLRTANYKPIDGGEDMWYSPIESTGAPKGQVLAVGKLRFVGEEETAAEFEKYEFTFQLIYRNAGDRIVGTHEFVVDGKVLGKPHKDYGFSQMAQLNAQYERNFTASVRLLKKDEKRERPGYRRRP